MNGDHSHSVASNPELTNYTRNITATEVFFLNLSLLDGAVSGEDVNGWVSPCGNQSYNGTCSDVPEDLDYIFDRIYVRCLFVVFYTFVFTCCVAGNLLVIVVVTFSQRLRSITNFFLTNLAIADLCVGIFCIFQNLSIYLISDWIFGDFLCKMYQFVHSLSYTASIFILVVICIERYFAIIHPITCKQILTSFRVKMIMMSVWVSSAAYSAPKLMWVQTITVDRAGGGTETICIQNRQKYNSKLFDMINFIFLYVIPLVIMIILYARIAIVLWRSSRGLARQMKVSNQIRSMQCSFKSTGVCKKHRRKYGHTCHPPDPEQPMLQRRITPRSIESRSKIASSKNILQARRGVINMLILVVCVFACCHLPFHARKMWQYWGSSYDTSSNFSVVFTPATFLVAYLNSAVNPLLYAFLSTNFRRGMQELRICYRRQDPFYVTYSKRRSCEFNGHSHSSNLSRKNSTRSVNCKTMTSSTVVKG